MSGNKIVNKNQIIPTFFLAVFIFVYFSLVYSFNYYAELQRYVWLFYFSFPVFYFINEVFYSILSKNGQTIYETVRINNFRSVIYLFVWLIMLFLVENTLNVFSPSVYSFFAASAMVLSLLYIILLKQAISAKILRIAITLLLSSSFSTINHELIIKNIGPSHFWIKGSQMAAASECSGKWSYGTDFEGCGLLGALWNPFDQLYNCAFSCPKKSFIKIRNLSANIVHEEGKVFAFLHYNIDTKDIKKPKSFTVEIFENGSLKLVKEEEIDDTNKYLEFSSEIEIDKPGEYRYTVKINPNDRLSLLGVSDEVRLKISDSTLVVMPMPDNVDRSSTLKVFPDLILKEISYVGRDQYYFTYCNEGNMATEDNLTIKIKSDPYEFLGKELVESMLKLNPKECRNTSDYLIMINETKKTVNKKEIRFSISTENEMEEIEKNNNVLTKDLNFFVLEGKCYDSDGGVNYYESGTALVYHNGGTSAGGYSDSCNNAGRTSGSGEYVHEVICKNNQPVDVELYKCPKGCKNGACLE